MGVSADLCRRRHEVQKRLMQFTRSLNENYRFRLLYGKGKSAAGRSMICYALRNGKKYNRLGFTVSTKLGCAVQRNLMRRRLREAYRLNEHLLRWGYDIVIVARSASAETDFEKLQKELLACLEKTGPLVRDK